MNKRKTINKLESAFIFGKVTRNDANILSKKLNMPFEV